MITASAPFTPFTSTLIIILIVIAILLIFYFATRQSPREYYTQHIAKSSGRFDNNAKTALATINQINNKTAEDYITAGNILNYNLLRAEHLQPAQMDNLRRQIAQLYINGIYQLNGNHERDRMIQEFGAAYRTPAADARIIFIGTFDDDIIPADTDTNTATATDTTVRNPNVIADILTFFNEDRGPNLGWQATRFVNETYNKLSDKKREDAAQLKTALVADGAKHTDVISETLDTFKEIRDDSQNVHDTSVNAGLKRTLDYLVKAHGNAYGGMAQLIAAPQYEHHSNKSEIDKTLGIIEAARGTVQPFNMTEGDIFNTIIARIFAPVNEVNRAALIDAFLDALAESAYVCSNGRCARMIASLTLLDAQPGLGIVKTKDMIRAEIYDEAKKIIDGEIQKAAGSMDETQRIVANYYSSGGSPPSPVAMAEFEQKCRAALDTCIDRYAADFTKAELQNIKEDCYTGI